MKNKKLFSLLFASILSLVGCNDKAEEELQPEILPPEVPHFKYSETEKLVGDGVTNYSIVIPDKNSSYISFASYDLQNILSEATGATFTIKSENDATTSSHIISLGNTKQFKQTHPDFDYSVFNNKDSKFLIDTVDDDIYFIGNIYGDDQNVLYASYAFLEDILQYRFYAKDEIYFEQKQNIFLPIYDKYIYDPSFDVRSIVNGDTVYDADYNKRAKVATWYVNDMWCDEAKGHNQFSLIKANYDLYNNPSWTNSIRSQLCWSSFDVVGEQSNGKTASEAVAERYIQLFNLYPNAAYFMFGQEDVTSFCTCDRCQQMMNEKAMNLAGLQIMFLNRVCEHLQPYFDANPNRQIKLVPYAYYSTKMAPVIRNDNNQLVPFSNYVIPNDHIYVEYAAIEANHVHPLTNDNISSNKEAMEVIDSWSVLLKPNHFIMYLYDTNFRCYFVNFNNFGAIEEDYKYLKSKNVFYIYSQGAVDSPIPNFSELRFFVETNLMWNLDKYNANDLTKEFIEHYYKDCKDEMMEYYNTSREILTLACTSLGSGTSAGGIYGTLNNSDVFPQEKVMYLNKLFKAMFSKIKKLENESKAELAQKLYLRVVREYLSVIYLNVTLYKNAFNKDELMDMKNIFTKYTSYFGMHATSENTPLELNFD